MTGGATLQRIVFKKNHLMMENPLMRAVIFPLPGVSGSAPIKPDDGRIGQNNYLMIICRKVPTSKMKPTDGT
ncbi:MAG: hypothetical protein P1V13_10125 [Rhizobiaceae bacterium]|nr:hypothetical protein [Rhizobiaceae bacterium]